VEFGVDAIVASNHGGRQLDGALPSIDALSDVTAAVGDGTEILVDSGIRSGSNACTSKRPARHGFATLLGSGRAATTVVVVVSSGWIVAMSPPGWMLVS
jgi:hypothetical protein